MDFREYAPILCSILNHGECKTTWGTSQHSTSQEVEREMYPPVFVHHLSATQSFSN